MIKHRETTPEKTMDGLLKRSRHSGGGGDGDGESDPEEAAAPIHNFQNVLATFCHVRFKHYSFGLLFALALSTMLLSRSEIPSKLLTHNAESTTSKNVVTFVSVEEVHTVLDDDMNKPVSDSSIGVNITESTRSVTLDPVIRQQQETKQMLMKMRDMGSTMNRFVTLNPDTNNLTTYKSLEKDLLAVLEQGLVLVGDSTTRMLYGFIYCVMEGMYRDGNETKGTDACRPVQDELLQNKYSIAVANFTSNYTNNLSLQYEPNYYLQSVDESVQQSLREFAGRYYYFGMPCLHELWSPGSRERLVHSDSSDWNDKFRVLFQDIHNVTSINHASFPSRVPMVGLTNSICDENMGVENRLINAYLRGEEMKGEASGDLIRSYNYGMTDTTKVLSSNYTGPIPVLEPCRANHTFDNATFNENGAVLCSKAGLSALRDMKTSTTTTFDPFVLDMHAATESSCSDSSDGRHYQGMTLVRQVSLFVQVHKRIMSTQARAAQGYLRSNYLR